MTETHAGGWIAPTETKPELSGSLVELTDIPLQPATLDVAHNRMLRKEQLADLPVERRGTLLSLCFDLFVVSWQRIVFGSCIQGAVFELQLSAEPATFSYLDGYLTVYLEPPPSHMHLCIGPLPRERSAGPCA